MSRRHQAALAATVGLALLSGCTTLGTNVRGSFSCSAPDGICAPSSVIDDRALALIAGERRPASAAAGEPALLRSAALPAGQVQLAGQSVLRIVFPAHVDALGRYHEQGVVRAAVDQRTWLTAAPAAAPADAEAALSASEAPAREVAAAGSAPNPAAVEAARARVTPVITRETIAAEAAAAVARPKANPPTPFPARVEE